MGRRRRLGKNAALQGQQRINHQTNNKKWPLLVRSLSDSAKYRRSISKIETSKAMTLSLSDSRLSSKKASNSLLELYTDKDSNEEEICSCGCDQALEELSYSEDEGCFVITSVPRSNVEELDVKVTNKVTKVKVLLKQFSVHTDAKLGCLPTQLPSKKEIFTHSFVSSKHLPEGVF